MTNFQYKARNQSGELVQGTRTSLDKKSLISELRGEGLFPINVNEAIATQENYFFTLFQKRVTAEMLQVFCRQMYSLCKAGVPLSNAIARMSEMAGNPRLKTTLIGISKSLSAGQKLSQAFQRYPDVFPKLMVNLIAIGEESGHLEESFLQVSNYFELETQTVKQLKTIFRYPVFVVIAVIVAIVVINIFVIPNFANLFSTFKTALPLPTRVLIATSYFLTHYWYIVMGVVIISYIVLRFFFKSTQGQLWWGRKQLRIPFFGHVIECILLARFTKSFSIVTRAGLGINQGLLLTADAMNNMYMRERILYMSTLVDRGEQLTSAARASNIFTPLILQMLDIGEQTGDFSLMMEEAAGFYEREVEYDLKRVGTIIEPILLIITAFMVLILALGVFLPMWDMVNFAKTS